MDDNLAPSTIRQQAEYVQYFIGDLPRHIKFMEKDDIRMDEALDRMADVQDKVLSLPDSIFKESILSYFRNNIMDNPGLNAVMNYMYDGTVSGTLLQWSADDLLVIYNLSCANDDIERIFSVSRAFLRSNRQAFNFENLRMKLMSNNVLKKVMRQNGNSNKVICAHIYCSYNLQISKVPKKRRVREQNENLNEEIVVEEIMNMEYDEMQTDEDDTEPQLIDFNYQAVAEDDFYDYEDYDDDWNEYEYE